MNTNLVMNHYLFALLFFLPAGVANSVPPLANKIPGLRNWKTPIDGGCKFRGKRLFGQNKTWRGIITGTALAGVTAVFLYPALGGDANRSLEFFIMGAAIGFGALLGDAVESFFKRQLNIASGNSLLIFDQIDYVIGAMLFSLPFGRFALEDYLAVIIVYITGHFIISYLSFKAGIKEKPV